MSEPTRPYLSVVVTSRNDDHGGDLLKRMQIFVTGFIEQVRRSGLDAELIIVEWNPPADRPRLVDALKWPADGMSCPVRIIEVPAAIHSRYRYAVKLPLYQMIAKNVGIRRADGAFVLATNIDLLFSNELAAFLSARKLDPRSMYRIDRSDVPSNVPMGDPLSSQLAFCAQNIIRINTQRGTIIVMPWHQRLAGKAKRYVLSRCQRVGNKWAQFRRERSARLALRWMGGYLLRYLRRIYRPVLAGLRFIVDPNERRRGRVRKLHTNACGDFTLLSREKWEQVRGYPELDMFSIHLDSVLCQMAYHAGCVQQVLKSPMRLYHIEHASGWSPDESIRLVRRMQALGVPLLSDDQYVEWARRMDRMKAPMEFNGPDWGLAGETLTEIRLGVEAGQAIR